MSSNFQRARRAIESASAEHIGEIIRILPAPMAIPQTYVPPSTYLKNGLTWSILIDHISQSFVFLQGHKAGDNFHAGKYLEFSPAEWLAAEEAWRETRPGMSGAILDIFPEDALDLDTWTETRGETPLPPDAGKWNPYRTAGGTYRIVSPELSNPNADSETPDWVQREADRMMAVRLAYTIRGLQKASASAATIEQTAVSLARRVIALLDDIAFFSPDATPAVNPTREQDGEA